MAATGSRPSDSLPRPTRRKDGRVAFSIGGHQLYIGKLEGSADAALLSKCYEHFQTYYGAHGLWDPSVKYDFQNDVFYSSATQKATFGSIEALMGRLKQGKGQAGAAAAPSAASPSWPPAPWWAQLDTIRCLCHKTPLHNHSSWALSRPQHNTHRQPRRRCRHQLPTSSHHTPFASKLFDAI